MRYLRRGAFLVALVLCGPFLVLALLTSMMLLVLVGRLGAHAVFVGVARMNDGLRVEWEKIP